MVDEHALVFITYFLWILLVEVIYGEEENTIATQGRLSFFLLA